MTAKTDVSTHQREANKVSTRRTYLVVYALVFLVAAMLRVGHYVDVRDSPFQVGHRVHLYDSVYYDALARRVAGGSGLSDEVYFMAPLYPYVLGMVYSAYSMAGGDLSTVGDYGPEIDFALVLQCLWGAGTCVLLSMLARRLAGDRAGILAGALAACYGPFVFHDSLMMATQLITFVNVAALLAFVSAAGRERWRSWLLAGLMLGVCAWAHGTALLLIPGAVLWAVVIWRGAALRKRLALAAAMGAVAGGCVGLATFRNHSVAGDAVLLTSNAGLTFWLGNNPIADGAFGLPPGDVMQLPGATLTSHLSGFERQPDDPKASEISNLLRDRALEFIFAEPAAEACLLWRKFRMFFGAVEIGSGDQMSFMRRFSFVLRSPLVSFGILAPIALTGMVCALQQWRKYGLLYLWVLAQTAAFVAVFVLGRYRLVTVSVLIVFAALQFGWWIDQGRARRFGRMGLSLLVLALFSVFVHWPIEGIGFDRGWGYQHLLLGQRYLQLGQPEMAADAFEQAMVGDHTPNDSVPGRFAAAINLFKIRRAQSRWDDALRAAQCARELFEQYPEDRRNEAVDAQLRRAEREARSHRR